MENLTFVAIRILFLTNVVNFESYMKTETSTQIEAFCITNYEMNTKIMQSNVTFFKVTLLMVQAVMLLEAVHNQILGHC